MPTGTKQHSLRRRASLSMILNSIAFSMPGRRLCRNGFGSFTSYATSWGSAKGRSRGILEFVERVSGGWIAPVASTLRVRLTGSPGTVSDFCSETLRAITYDFHEFTGRVRWQNGSESHPIGLASLSGCLAHPLRPRRF